MTRDPQQLSDERRYDIPVTVIATEFTSEMLRKWIEQGEEPVREFTKIREVEYVDLPTGHWPQFTRPDASLAAWRILGERGDVVSRVRSELDVEFRSPRWVTGSCSNSR